MDCSICGLVKKSALVTEFAEYFHEHKVLNLLFCGGDYE